jgi:hypothetical protein
MINNLEIPVPSCSECIIEKGYCRHNGIVYGDEQCSEIWFKDRMIKDEKEDISESS